MQFNDIPDNQLPSCHFLYPRQISMIDEALVSLGDSGEVHLIVQKRRLRFLVIQKSIDLDAAESDHGAEGSQAEDGSDSK